MYSLPGIPTLSVSPTSCFILGPIIELVFDLKMGDPSLCKTMALPGNLEASARNGNLLVIENKMTHFSRVRKVTSDCCPCHIRSSDRL